MYTRYRWSLREWRKLTWDTELLPILEFTTGVEDNLIGVVVGELESNNRFWSDNKSHYSSNFSCTSSLNSSWGCTTCLKSFDVFLSVNIICSWTWWFWDVIWADDDVKSWWISIISWVVLDMIEALGTSL